VPYRQYSVCVAATCEVDAVWPARLSVQITERVGVWSKSLEVTHQLGVAIVWAKEPSGQKAMSQAAGENGESSRRIQELVAALEVKIPAHYLQVHASMLSP
jgi:hypothetical protein